MYLHIFLSNAVHEQDSSSPPHDPLIVLLKNKVPALSRKKDKEITIKVIKVKNNSIINFKLK